MEAQPTPDTDATSHQPVLEFDIRPADVPALLRSPALAARRHGRCRTSRIAIIWHDTAAGALKARGLAIAEQAGRWRLERLRPNGAADWPPATPAPVLAEAASAGQLGADVTDPLVAVAAFAGTRRSYNLLFGNEAGRLDVLEGALRGVAHDLPASRLQIAGPQPGLAGFAAELATQVDVAVPRAGLAAEAIAVAHGTRPLPRHLGAPHVLPGLTVAASLALVTGHLADVILYWAPIAPGGDGAEPVHQMRVAVRRLRAALMLFRRVTVGTALPEVELALKDLAARLGRARDWDVFLDDTGADIRSAFPADMRVRGLVAAAAKRRAAAYAALRDYVDSAAWRQLALRLALLPTTAPWVDPDDAGQAELLAGPIEAHAARVLDRLHRRLLQQGADMATLPADALHAVRKRAKKIRYGTEFFVLLFPAKRVKRFLDRLEDLQEALGAVNDGHVAADLMGQLGGGADRAFAAGAVQGYVAARSGKTAGRALKSWTKYAQQETFWN
jgi:CHAD domain-containing protein